MTKVHALTANDLVVEGPQGGFMPRINQPARAVAATAPREDKPPRAVGKNHLVEQTTNGTWKLYRRHIIEGDERYNTSEKERWDIVEEYGDEEAAVAAARQAQN